MIHSDKKVISFDFSARVTEVEKYEITQLFLEMVEVPIGEAINKFMSSKVFQDFIGNKKSWDILQNSEEGKSLKKALEDLCAADIKLGLAIQNIMRIRIDHLEMFVCAAIQAKKDQVGAIGIKEVMESYKKINGRVSAEIHNQLIDLAKEKAFEQNRPTKNSTVH